METYYESLGIQEGVSADHIKISYRLLMRQYHPDLFQSQPAWVRIQAEAKSKEINEAYSVLSDSAKRKHYDEVLYSRRNPYVPSSTPPAPKPAAKKQEQARPNVGASYDIYRHCVKCGKIATNVPKGQDICRSCQAVTVPKKPSSLSGSWMVWVLSFMFPYALFPISLLYAWIAKKWKLRTRAKVLLCFQGLLCSLMLIGRIFPTIDHLILLIVIAAAVLTVVRKR